MVRDFSDKVVVVTGSSSGLGFYIARRFAKLGANVVLNGRNHDKLKKAVESCDGTVVCCAADLSEPDGASHLVDFVMKTYGQLDVLVCNVGSGSSVSPGQEHYEEWLRVFGQNFFATTNMVEASRGLLRSSQGDIVCISSICGRQVIKGAPITYSVAKAALNAYVKGMARPLGEDNIRINAVEPGNLLFEGSVWDRKIAEDREAVAKMLETEVSLGRLGEPDEIASLVIFLASEDARFLTGAVYTADGGQSVC